MPIDISDGDEGLSAKLDGLNVPGRPVTVTVPVTVCPASYGPVGVDVKVITGAGFTVIISCVDDAVSPLLSVASNVKAYVPVGVVDDVSNTHVSDCASEQMPFAGIGVVPS